MGSVLGLVLGKLSGCSGALEVDVEGDLETACGGRWDSI